MSGKVQTIDWHESTEELYARYRDEPDLERRKRVQALWLVRGGETATAAARQAGISRRTITRWLDWYRVNGLDDVLRRVPSHGAVGASCRLSSAQQQALLAQCQDGAFRTYEEARRWVDRTYDIEYGYQGMYKVLVRLGVHPKVPRPTAAKGDPAVREAWKKGGSERPSLTKA